MLCASVYEVLLSTPPVLLQNVMADCAWKEIMSVDGLSWMIKQQPKRRRHPSDTFDSWDVPRYAVDNEYALPLRDVWGDFCQRSSTYWWLALAWFSVCSHTHLKHIIFAEVNNQKRIANIQQLSPTIWSRRKYSQHCTIYKRWTRLTWAERHGVGMCKKISIMHRP